MPHPPPCCDEPTDGKFMMSFFRFSSLHRAFDHFTLA